MAGLFTGVFLIIWLVVIVLIVAGFWKTFEKAGKPGWAAIVPIYNAIVLCEIAGKPTWWGITVLCGPVWFILSLFVCIDLAKKFGQGTGFAIGLWLFGPIFFPILGFGSARYNAAASTA